MTERLMPPTNRELAERFGVSRRTITNATKRDPRWWTERRRALRQKAAALRDTGMRWADVGKALGGVSENAARAMAKRARGEWADGSPARTADDNQRGLAPR